MTTAAGAATPAWLAHTATRALAIPTPTTPFQMPVGSAPTAPRWRPLMAGPSAHRSAALEVRVPSRKGVVTPFTGVVSPTLAALWTANSIATALTAKSATPIRPATSRRGAALWPATRIPTAHMKACGACRGCACTRTIPEGGLAARAPAGGPRSRNAVSGSARARRCSIRRGSADATASARPAWVPASLQRAARTRPRTCDRAAAAASDVDFPSRADGNFRDQKRQVGLHNEQLGQGEHGLPAAVPTPAVASPSSSWVPSPVAIAPIVVCARRRLGSGAGGCIATSPRGLATKTCDPTVSADR